MAFIGTYIGLGSNLGARFEYLRSGCVALENAGVKILERSSVYCSQPVGGPGGQNDYYNAVVRVEADCSAPALLAICQHVETLAGRERTERWGSRTLDLDILLFGPACIDTPELQVPHPRMLERRFVLEPLAEIAPHVIHPRAGRSIVELLSLLPEAPRVCKTEHAW